MSPRDTAVVLASLEPSYSGIGPQVASGFCMPSLRLLHRLNACLWTAALLVIFGGCGDDNAADGGGDAASSSDACARTHGCYCAPQEEGKSTCLECGSGYECVHGRRQFFFDGVCDARSAACMGDMDVDSGAASE